MKIPDIEEHLSCFNYDLSEKSAIQILSFKNKEVGELVTNSNKIIFILNGEISFTFKGKINSYCEGKKGQMLFLPEIGSYSYNAKMDTEFILFRINSLSKLCNDFSIERLSYLKNKEYHEFFVKDDNDLGKLYINSRLYYYLKGIKICITDGLRCRCWFDLKIKEFFTLIRVYYSKEDIGLFFFHKLNADMEFSDFVHLNWHRFRNVNEMAAHLNMSSKLFSSKFFVVFGIRPSRWIIEQKAFLINRELNITKKPFKQISIEYGFSTVASFTRFCKNELGDIPSNIRNKK